jgi:hypothetical protein
LGSHKENTQDMVERGRSAKGESHGRAKLTEKDVQSIRTKFATGNYTKRALANEYSISADNVRAIVTRQTWKHVK